jgi:hypothetical protein
MRLFRQLALPLVILGLCLPLTQPARAQEVHRGYLWSLVFDFENNFDGVMTIKVGPWVNGDLAAADETSTATVHCEPVGNVYLDGGDAVFAGGHLTCEMDLGALVAANHDVDINAVDSYGSIVMRTVLESDAQNIASIFSHPDAAYTINFSRTWSVTTVQSLNNQAGVQKTSFPVAGASRQAYGFEYGCAWQGNCHGEFQALPHTYSTAPGGERVSFHTAPATFLIGSGPSGTFQGRIGTLAVDPGNSIQ